ncbi:hypothetical protein [Nocardia cerradoensis]|nr:hypothetical protein [Nocardia cerradoensis]
MVSRPPLTRHPHGPRSTAHYWYIGLELLKVVGLIGLALAAAP